MMMILHKMIATTLGIGYLGKGGGTIAAIACCLVWYFVARNYNSAYGQFFLTLVVCILGTWSSNRVDAIWGKDSNKVVIDEVAGMMITLVFIPVTVGHVIAGLVLFRVFDIAKPLFIRNLEALPKGYGVMADDILAGVYAHVVLWLIVHFNLL